MNETKIYIGGKQVKCFNDFVFSLEEEKEESNLEGKKFAPTLSTSGSFEITEESKEFFEVLIKEAEKYHEERRKQEEEAKEIAAKILELYSDVFKNYIEFLKKLNEMPIPKEPDKKTHKYHSMQNLKQLRKHHPVYRRGR